MNIFFPSNDSHLFIFTPTLLHNPCLMSMFLCFCHAQNLQPSKAEPPVSIASYCCICSIYINLIVHYILPVIAITNNYVNGVGEILEHQTNSFQLQPLSLMSLFKQIINQPLSIVKSNHNHFSQNDYLPNTDKGLTITALIVLT